MDVRNPFATVTPTLDGPVLRVLARAAVPLTTQQVIDLSEAGSPAGIRKVLRRLADQGVVVESRVGQSYTYEGNREHLAWPAVELLANLVQRMDEKIVEAVRAWDIQPLSVELFGSTVRGESSPSSDIDILVVAPQLTDDDLVTWQDQLRDLQEAVGRWTGNSVDVLDLAPDELVGMVADAAPAVTGPRHRVVGAATSDLMPRSLAEALTRSSWSQKTSNSLAASLTPSMSRLLVELGPSWRHELPESVRAALVEMSPEVELLTPATRTATEEAGGHR